MVYKPWTALQDFEWHKEEIRASMTKRANSRRQVELQGDTTTTSSSSKDSSCGTSDGGESTLASSIDARWEDQADEEEEGFNDEEYDENEMYYCKCFSCCHSSLQWYQTELLVGVSMPQSSHSPNTRTELAVLSQCQDFPSVQESSDSRRRRFENRPRQRSPQQQQVRLEPIAETTTILR